MKRFVLPLAVAMVLGTAATASAQVWTSYYAPVTTYYAPATSASVVTGSPMPTTVYYSAPAPVTTYYAPTVVEPVTTYYAPAPVTTYYAPAPVTAYYAPGYTVTARRGILRPRVVRYRYW